MTCVPLEVSPKRYFCACDSAAATKDSTLNWNVEWTEMLQPDVGLKDTLSKPGTWSFDFKIKLGLGYLVKTRAPLASQIEVSSTYDGRYVSEHVRINGNSSPEKCAWISNTADRTNPWIMFDFLRPYKAMGVLIRTRCGQYSAQHVLTADVSYSNDNITYSYAIESLEITYPAGNSFSYWFDEPATARYWKIHPLTWNIHPAMKADNMGYI